MVEAFFLFIGCFIWFGYWGAESGASLPWSSKWQKAFGINLRQVPEIVFATSAAGAWVYIRNMPDELPLWINVYDFLTASIVMYAGKQAATWALLSNVFTEGYQRDDNGDGVVDYNDGRKSKIKNVADDLAESLNIPITSPKYALVWAFVKGALMTLPIGLGLVGGVFHALGHWIAMKLFYNPDGTGKVKKPNAYKEWVGSGLCIAVSLVAMYAISMIAG